MLVESSQFFTPVLFTRLFMSVFVPVRMCYWVPYSGKIWQGFYLAKQPPKGISEFKFGDLHVPMLCHVMVLIFADLSLAILGKFIILPN